MRIIFSNVYPKQVNYRGLIYPNPEAVFQAQRCEKEEDKVKYTMVKNPVVAKWMGKILMQVREELKKED